MLPPGLAERIAEADQVVVFTGAGMSAESGVPTFRDDLTGLWSRFDAFKLATPEAFQADPDLVWGWYEWRRARVQRAAPNAGHRAVAALEALIPRTLVVTQNVDDLHERAGSRSPVHLHGSLFTPYCTGAEAHPAELPEHDPFLADPGAGGPVPPPSCLQCGALIRPGVVWFGEPLPIAPLTTAIETAVTCDVLLTIGTSGAVYPASEVPGYAARNGATVIQINPAPTDLDAICDVNLRGTAATVLPALVAAVRQEISG